MLRLRPALQPLWLKRCYATAAKAATSPPQPPAYKPIPPEQRTSKHPEYPEEPEPVTPKKPNIFARILSDKNDPLYALPPDPARGKEATDRVVRDGVLDPRYKRAARSYTAIIVALPIFIYTTYELFQRRFMGKEQKRPPVAPVPADATTP